MRLGVERGIAQVQHFLQQFAGTFLVANLDVSLGQIELDLQIAYTIGAMLARQRVRQVGVQTDGRLRFVVGDFSVLCVMRLGFEVHRGLRQVGWLGPARQAVLCGNRGCRSSRFCSRRRRVQIQRQVRQIHMQRGRGNGLISLASVRVELRQIRFRFGMHLEDVRSLFGRSDRLACRRRRERLQRQIEIGQLRCLGRRRGRIQIRRQRGPVVTATGGLARHRWAEGLGGHRGTHTCQRSRTCDCGT
ncbi:hypothetical protein DP23_4338 [Ralstonia pickettii]|nr:hypothetical protein DP23_4338 [Ralstonia pickettii]